MRRVTTSRVIPYLPVCPAGADTGQARPTKVEALIEHGRPGVKGPASADLRPARDERYRPQHGDDEDQVAHGRLRRPRMRPQDARSEAGSGHARVPRGTPLCRAGLDETERWRAK